MQDRLPVGGEQLLERRLGDLVLTFEVLEQRSVLDLRPQPETHQAERARDQERNPPAPLLHGRVAENDRAQRHRGGTEEEAHEGAELQPAAEEAAPLGWGVLGDERGRTPVLTTGGEALQTA